MALFHFLFFEKDRLGITLRAAHVNHGVRGDAADADEAFVRAQCECCGVPLDVCHLVPPPSFSEDWGRRQRYAFFDALAARFNAKVATAHTLSDNAETVLLHLARGAGMHGAGGIPPVRGVYVRPLLACTRGDVEAYLAKGGFSYVTDATNAQSDYARNRVRQTLLPALEAVHPGAAHALARFAQAMRETAQHLDTEAAALLCESAKALPDAAPAYDAKMILAAPQPVRRAALRALIAPVADPTAVRIEAAEHALKTSGALTLSRQNTLTCRQGLLRMSCTDAACAPPMEEISFAQALSLGEFTAQDGAAFTFSTQRYEDFIKFQKQRTKVLKNIADCDKIPNNTCLRTRASGDIFAPAGRGVTKPLKKLFSEAKLSASFRAAAPVLACGSTVLWVAGFGFAQSVLPGADTRTVLIIDKNGGKSK